MKQTNTAVVEPTRSAGAGFTPYEKELRRVLRALIEKSDGLIEAIDLSTDQFATETAELSAAASAAEKVLKLSGEG